MSLHSMTLAGQLANNILGMSFEQAIMGSGKKKKSLRILMRIKKRKGYKRAHHHRRSKPVKLHGGKRRRHLKKHRG